MARSSFARGVVLTFGTNLAQLFVGVAASILAARLLGPEDLGRYSLALLFAVVVVTFSNFGLAPAATYHVSRGVRPLGEIVGNNVLASLAVGALGVLGGGAVAYFLGDRVLQGVPVPVILLALLLVPLSHVSANLRAILHGQQRFRAYNASLLAESALKLLLVGAVLWAFRGGVREAVAANVLAVALVAGALLAALDARRASWRVSPSYLKESFDYGAKAYVGNAIQFLNYRVDMLLLNAWHGPAAVGFYSVAVVFAERLRMISGAASVVLFPRVAAAHAAGDHRSDTAAVCRVVLWASAAASLAFWAVSHWVVVLLYSPAFEAAVRPLQILLPGIAVLSVAEIVAHDFAGRGKPIINTIIAAITLVMNVALLLLLVPRWGVQGAAWATTISYFAQAVIWVGWFLHLSGHSVADVLVPRREDVERVRGMIRAMLRRAPAA